MTRYFAVIVFTLALLRGGPASAVSFEWSFATDPGGTLTGTVGETVGWGYFLTNLDDGRWLELAGVEVPVPADPPIASIVSLGDLRIAGPGEVLHVEYDGFNGLASAELLASGTDSFPANPLFFFSIRVNWWDVDPLAAGPSDAPVGDDSIEVGASLEVANAESVRVPEPSDVILLALGLGLLAVMPRLMPHIARGGRK